MVKKGLILKNLINEDPLGNTYQAVFKNNDVIVKKYSNDVSEIILENFLEFKTYCRASQRIHEDIICELIDIMSDDKFVYVVYKQEGSIKFISEVISSGELNGNNFDFVSNTENNFWIELLQPLIISLKKAHHLGNFHGLLNPYNIAFTENYKIKLFGFGFEYKVLQWISKSNFTKISNQDTYFIPYLNFDAIVYNKFNIGSDTYSIATLIYHLLSGEAPYDNVNAKEAKELDVSLKPIELLSKKKFKVLKEILTLDATDVSDCLDILESTLYNPKSNSKSHGRSYFVTLSVVLCFGVVAYIYKNTSYVIKEKHYNPKETKNLIVKKVNNNSVSNNSVVTVKKEPALQKSLNIKNEHSKQTKPILVNTSVKNHPEVIKTEQKLEPVNNIAPKPSPKKTKRVIKRKYKIIDSKKSNSSCSSKIINGVAKRVCNDVLKNQVKGPQYYTLNIDNSSKKLSVTTPIRVIDYKKYCYFSKKCDYFTADTSYKKSELLGKDFNEVMSSIKKYNIYCLLTDNCAGLNNNKIKQPIVGLSHKEITDYISWLNMVSGSKYEILDNKLVLKKVEKDFKKGCNLNNKLSNSLCNVMLNNYKKNQSSNSNNQNLQTAYVLVRK